MGVIVRVNVVLLWVIVRVYVCVWLCVCGCVFVGVCGCGWVVVCVCVVVVVGGWLCVYVFVASPKPIPNYTTLTTVLLPQLQMQRNELYSSNLALLSYPHLHTYPHLPPLTPTSYPLTPSYPYLPR